MSKERIYIVRGGEDAGYEEIIAVATDAQEELDAKDAKIAELTARLESRPSPERASQISALQQNVAERDELIARLEKKVSSLETECAQHRTTANQALETQNAYIAKSQKFEAELIERKKQIKHMQSEISTPTADGRRLKECNLKLGLERRRVAESQEAIRRLEHSLVKIAGFSSDLLEAGDTPKLVVHINTIANEHLADCFQSRPYTEDPPF